MSNMLTNSDRSFTGGFSTVNYDKAAPGEGQKHPHDVPVRTFSPRLISTVMLWVLGYGTATSVYQWGVYRSDGTATAARREAFQWRLGKEAFLRANWKKIVTMVRAGTMADYARKFGDEAIVVEEQTQADGVEDDREGEAGNHEEEEGAGEDAWGAQDADKEEPAPQAEPRTVCDSSVRTRTHAPLECGAREKSLHDNTMADLRPCMSRADCETFPRCENVIRRDLVEVRLCNHLMADPRQDEPVMNIQRGLFCKSAGIPTGTWVASFGPVVANDRSMRSELGYAVQVRRGNPQREGSWSRKVECVTPVLGWQDKHRP